MIGKIESPSTFDSAASVCCNPDPTLGKLANPCPLAILPGPPPGLRPPRTPAAHTVLKPTPLDEDPLQPLNFNPETPTPSAAMDLRSSTLPTLAVTALLALTPPTRSAHALASGYLTSAGGGSFAASFRLPELASHGAFVVEDIAGERPDTNGGKHFNLLVHGEDKSSLADALTERAVYYRDRDPAIARQSMERALELRREVVAEQHPGDSVTVTFTDSSVRLTGEDRDRGELPPDGRWTRIWERWRQNGDSRSALDEFEAEWPAVRDKRTGMSNSALLIAVRTRDLAAADRWAGRILDNGWTDPWSDKLMVARMISQIPGRRGRALELARGAMADLDAVDFARDPGRPLGQTAREYAGVIARARADALIEHYQLLAEAGFEEESLDVLEAATAESAEPGLFRRLGELRLGRGDTAGAALAFAVVASDPGTLPGEARALARRAGHSADSPEWRRLLDSATATALPRALAGAVRRPLPPVRVADAEGERFALEQIVGDEPAVVVFWARWCGPCIEEIPEVARLARSLEPQGVRLRFSLHRRCARPWDGCVVAGAPRDLPRLLRPRRGRRGCLRRGQYPGGLHTRRGGARSLRGLAYRRGLATAGGAGAAGGGAGQVEPETSRSCVRAPTTPPCPAAVRPSD